MRGVSDAIHQSFTSEEEAKRLFEQEDAKGNTKVTGNDTSGNLPQASLSLREPSRPPSSQSLHLRNVALNSPSSSPTSRNSHRLPTHRPEQYTSRTGHAISRSASESLPSPRTVYLGHEPKFQQQAGSPNKYITRGLPVYEERHATRAVVQTPSWLVTSYPSDSEAGLSALSPLSKRDVPLSPISSPRRPSQKLKPEYFGYSPQMASRVKPEPERHSRKSSFEHHKSYKYDAEGTPVAIQPQLVPAVMAYPHTCYNCDAPQLLGLVQPMHVPHMVHKPADDPRSPMSQKLSIPISTK